MKQTGIIMSGDHPTKILDGTKTMTRRVVKPEWKKLIHDFDNAFVTSESSKLHVPVRHPEEPDFSDKRITRIYCPGLPHPEPIAYLAIGAVDSLWDDAKPSKINAGVAIWFPASADLMNIPMWVGKFRSSIYMPRWASRITLEITGIRVERLQEITHEDAIAEGTKYMPNAAPRKQRLSVAQIVFAGLWDSLNAKRGYGWETNPWVWVIVFKHITPP